MKAKILAKYTFTCLDLDINKVREVEIGSIDYTNDSVNGLRNFISSLVDYITMEDEKISNWNRAAILGSSTTVNSITIRFCRDDGTVVDEVTVSHDTPVEAKQLVVGFCTL